MLGVLAAAGLLAVLMVSGEVETPGQATDRAAPPPRQPVTAAVEKRVLVDEVVTRGTVQSAGALEYAPPATGSGSRYEVLFAPGDTVNAGDAVALVDGRPVLLLEGDGQLGADVGPMSSGRDVERLQSGLRSLGLEIPESESGSVGPATQAAIDALYDRAGLVALTTTEATGGGGGIAAGGESLEAKRSRLRRAVDEARGALDAAEASAANAPDLVAPARLNLETAIRKVAEAEAARDAAVDAATRALEAAREAGSGTDAAAAALRDAQRSGDASVADARAQAAAAQVQLDEASRQAAVAAAQADQLVRSARSSLAAAQEALAEAARRDGLVVPRAEILFVPELPTTVLSVEPPSVPGSMTPLFTLRSGELVVNVDMPPGVRPSSAASGVAESDDGSVALEIAASTSVPTGPAAEPARPGGSWDGPATATTGTAFGITATTRGEAVAGMNLRVTLSTPVTDEEVLAVPLRAIVTGNDGRSYVRVREGDEFRRIEVRVGRSGSGMVEVTDPDGAPLTDLAPGDEVRVS